MPTVATTAVASARSKSAQHAKLVVGRHLAKLEPEDPGRLLDREMGLLGRVDGPPGRSSRAAASAASVEVEAASSMCPWRPAGSPRSCASQSRVTCSSSVAAGEVSQDIAFTFSAATSSSARIPGREPVFAKSAKNRGWFQSVSPGRSARRSRAGRRRKAPACSGAEAGSRARISPGRTSATTGRSPTRVEVGGDPVRAAARSSRNVIGRRFRSRSICFQVRVLTTSSSVATRGEPGRRRTRRSRAPRPGGRRSRSRFQARLAGGAGVDVRQVEAVGL